MASISDEDQNIPSETGRKTRSGRKPSINVPVTPTRATRRSSRRGAHQEPEPEPEAIHDEIQQNIIEELQEEIEQPESIDDDKSSSFPYGQYNEICGPTDQASDSIDNLLANLAEDNANSLPSTGDDTEFNVKHQFMQQSESNDIADDIYGDIQSNDIDCPMTDANTEAIAEDLKNGADSEKTTVTTPEELIESDHVIQEASNDAKDTDNQTNEISKKRKIDENYDPGSPTTESSEIPEKKLKEAIEEKIEEQVEKRLPELDKYWKAVKDDPTDFTGWTYLLQYVDQENNIIAAREAYDAFLSHYPYCYGYWRKYADYEKRKGDAAKCEEVFERGLKAIPLSVDLWIHYLNHVKTTHTVDTDYIRTQFERAIEACGLEFRSDKLWDAYIKWETEAGRITHVVGIYDRLLATPTQGYNGHFYSFQELVSNNSIQSLLQSDEIQPLLENIREEINQEKEQSENIESETGTDADQISETEITAIKDKILSIRRRIHKQTVTSVTARWTYEEGIKRPYFHVKPLERCQLKNWKDYLDFEIEQGDLKRTLVLFERCLIACALYDEFWLKLIRFLESKNDPEMNSRIRDAFERACKIHHPDKPSLHLMWSAFEECQNNIESAAEILTNLDALCPNLLQVAYRRVNLERRRGNLDECDRLYNHYIENAKNKNVVGSLAIKYARFLHKIRGNLQQGYDVLKSILEKDNSNTRVALQMIDLALQRESVDENEIVEIIDKFMTRDGIEPEQRVLFAQRKVEFLEDFGSSAKGLQEAQRALHSALAVVNELKKKANETSPSKSKPKEAGDATAPQVATTNATAATNYNYNYNTAASASNYYGNTANAGYQAYGEGYNYNQWQQFGSNYSGYGQWSGYGSNGYY